MDKHHTCLPQYSPTPIDAFLSICRPLAATKLHGLPCFLVNILHTVAASVQLRELQERGKDDIP